jgi:hypothetical protein
MQQLARKPETDRERKLVAKQFEAWCRCFQSSNPKRSDWIELSRLNAEMERVGLIATEGTAS